MIKFLLKLWQEIQRQRFLLVNNGSDITIRYDVRNWQPTYDQSVKAMEKWTARKAQFEPNSPGYLFAERQANQAQANLLKASLKLQQSRQLGHIDLED